MSYFLYLFFPWEVERLLLWLASQDCMEQGQQQQRKVGGCICQIALDWVYSEP